MCIRDRYMGKNTTSTKNLNDGLARLPRAFYGVEQHYKTYIESDAELTVLLRRLEEGKFLRDHYVEALSVIPDRNNPNNAFILLISFEHILYLSQQDRKLLWHIPTVKIANVDTNTPDKVTIVLTETSKKNPDRQVVIVTRDQRVTNHIITSIRRILEDIQQS
eukprot:TRINITY_DN6517_c0_g2_i4.p1 TRINITY_DN6517_c0_g2~~TRINITY_DN6517_c0_g2_i4.p1  ORF type:complete len:179 (+),score=45.10 TRINITY_DN6517_c0_g2_i4:51-539(+)